MAQIIIITGGTGTGKTTILKELNFKNTIYLDQYIKNNWYIEGHPLFNKLVEEFGVDVIANNTINTSALGKIIFCEEGIKNNLIDKLNRIVFPYIFALFENIKNSNNKKLYIIEMAIYMNHIKVFKPYIDYVIQLLSPIQDIDGKFQYLKNKHIPLKNKKIEANLYITRENGLKKLKEFLRNNNEYKNIG